MVTDWNSTEHKILKKLHTPYKIAQYLAQLEYKITDGCSSPRKVMQERRAHCFDGALMAAAALEYHGYKPLIVDLWAQDDDEHLICVYKDHDLWGSIAKSNTSLLLERSPVYQNIRELVMSYFDLYFNYHRQLGLYAYSKPINLNIFNTYKWRTSDKNLEFLSPLIDQQVHYEIIDPKKLKKMSKVNSVIHRACFHDSNLAGVKK